MLPVAEYGLLSSASSIYVHPIRVAFMMLLMAMGVCNYIFTRFALAALLFGGGQFLISVPNFLGPAADYRPFAAGSLLIALAAIMAFLSSRRSIPSEPDVSGIWRRFRDAFGAIWALRVIERMNRSGERLGWNTKLEWSGFRHVAASSSKSGNAVNEPVVLSDVAERSFRMLLRRFVSSQWYDPAS